jgi:hypothetical protein
VDVVANAERILSDLRAVFPAAAGRFLVGPMAKLTWGTPALLTGDLGLIVELPEPVRVALLGVVRAVLPEERAAVLRLQVNFLGVIDVAQRRVSFDAALFESRLLAFTLTGDMALRLCWGAEANFLVTVGGFHPAYQPPPLGLPALRRLTVALVSGENPRLTLETYLAVTSNTAQVGARVELYAAAWKFNAYGFLSFDVLFQFSPFGFVADVTAQLALRVGTSSIASIKLTLRLEGPTPWTARGEARLKLCWFLTVKVHFSKTFGERRVTTVPDVAVVPLLVAALGAADNWVEERAAGQPRVESLRERVRDTTVMVHPVGTLTVGQKVVPLNVAIDRVGSQRPADGREFRIVGGAGGDGGAAGSGRGGAGSVCAGAVLRAERRGEAGEPVVPGVRQRGADRRAGAAADGICGGARGPLRDQVHRFGAGAAARGAGGGRRRRRGPGRVRRLDAARRDRRVGALVRAPAEVSARPRRGGRRPGALCDRLDEGPVRVRRRQPARHRTGRARAPRRARRREAGASRLVAGGAGF